MESPTTSGSDAASTTNAAPTTPVTETVHSAPTTPVSPDTVNSAAQQAVQQPTAQQSLSNVSEEVIRFLRKQERDRLFSNLQTLGVPIAKNDKGHRDLKASLDAYLVEAAAKEPTVATPVAPPVPETPSLDEKAYRQEIESYKARILQAEQQSQAYQQQLAKIESEKDEFIVRSELSAALQSIAAPTYFEDAVDRFFREYHVEKGDNGAQYWLDSAGNIIIGTHGKPATVPEVAQQFLQRFPRYAAPTANPGANPAGVPVVGARIVSNADIAAARVDINDIIAQRVIVQ